MFTPWALKDKVTPCLFYIHGGGFAFRATDVQYHYEQQYALNCNCRVIGIDYHLLPKHIYPVAVNECIDTYRYIVEQASSLRIDTDKIVMDGLLSLETYFRLKETEIKQPKGLMLIYPVTDHTSSTESIRKYTDTPVWDGKANKVFWEKYLGGQDYTSPLQRADEISVDHLFVEGEEFDCLHDEGKLLFEKARANVANSVLVDNIGTFHAYDANYDAEISKKSLAARCDFLRGCF